MKKRLEITLGLTRIVMGFIFLWAFLDKTFGLGFSTASDKAWLLGNSPTAGFLTGAVKGPLASFYHSLSGSLFVDWIFMLGLLLIGVSLILGIFNKISAYSGALLMLLMFGALMPPTTNPLVDDHIVYALLLLVLNFARAGDYIGMRKAWGKTSLVRKFKFLE